MEASSASRRRRSPLRAPARSSRRSATAVAARPLPSRIFSATVVPFGATMTMTPSAPVLAKTPSRSMTIVSGRPGPSIAHGFSRTARTSAPALRCSANGEVGEAVPTRWIALASADEARRVDRCTASVDRRRCRLVADEALDDVADMDLHRMLGREVAVRVPAVHRAGQQHRGVLSRAVHADAPPARSGRGRARRASPDRSATRRGTRGRLAEASGIEDVSDHRDMAIGAGVARRRKGEPLALEGSAGGQAGEGLQRLEARPGKDRGGRISELLDDDAVGRQDDRRARVPGFDESAPFDDGQLDSVGGGEGLRHHASLPPTPAAMTRARLGRCSANTATVCRPPGRATAARARAATAITTAPSRSRSTASRPCTPRATSRSGGTRRSGIRRICSSRRSASATCCRTCTRACRRASSSSTIGTRHPESWSRTAAEAGDSPRSCSGRT